MPRDKWRATLIESPAPDGRKHYAIYIGPDRMEVLPKALGQQTDYCKTGDEERGENDGSKGEGHVQLRVSKLRSNPEPG